MDSDQLGSNEACSSESTQFSKEGTAFMRSTTVYIFHSKRFPHTFLVLCMEALM